MSGGIAPFIEGLIKATEAEPCTTCRHYAYLTTLDVHLCHGACKGEIASEDVPKGGDCWEPRKVE